MAKYPGDSRAPYQQIADALRRRIEEGVYEEGSKLPSQHALCEEFGVSRMTVQASLRELRREGLVYSRQGSGIFVSGRSRAEENLWKTVSAATQGSPSYLIARDPLSVLKIDERLMNGLRAEAANGGVLRVIAGNESEVSAEGIRGILGLEESAAFEIDIRATDLGELPVDVSYTAATGFRFRLVGRADPEVPVELTPALSHDDEPRLIWAWLEGFWLSLRGASVDVVHPAENISVRLDSEEGSSSHKHQTR